eukprot:UN04462
MSQSMEREMSFNQEDLTPDQVRSRLTPNDIAELEEAFQLFDKHSLGYVLKPDLREMLKTIGYNLNDKELEHMITKVDVDNNRKIDIDEFIVLIANLESDEKHEAEIIAAFNAFDYTGQGYVRANDIRRVLKFCNG